MLRDEAFDSSDEKLAVALGRTTQEVKAWFSGNEPVDADVLLKARGIAMERAWFGKRITPWSAVPWHRFGKQYQSANKLAHSRFYRFSSCSI